MECGVANPARIDRLSVDLLYQRVSGGSLGIIRVETMEIPQQSPCRGAVAGVARQPCQIQKITAGRQSEIGVRLKSRPGDIECFAGVSRRQQSWQQLLGQAIGKAWVGPA